VAATHAGANLPATGTLVMDMLVIFPWERPMELVDAENVPHTRHRGGHLAEKSF
jgi:hypothetical protein